MNTPEIRRAGRTCPAGTNARTERAKNNPSVTKLTDMNEYRKASNFDHPLTKPGAFLRNRGGASPTAAISCPPWLEPTSSVHQLIVLDPQFLGIEVDDRGLKRALLVGAPRVDRQGLAQLHAAFALGDVSVQGHERLVLHDRVADGLGADRPHGAPSGDELHVRVECGGLVEVGAVRRGMEVEDGPPEVRSLFQHAVD